MDVQKITFDKLLVILAKLKAAYVRGLMVLRPLTKEQKFIFDAFDMDYPKNLF